MIENLPTELMNYGMGGMFIIYLIYDRQVIIKGLKESMNELKLAIISMKGG